MPRLVSPAMAPPLLLDAMNCLGAALLLLLPPLPAPPYMGCIQKAPPAHADEIGPVIAPGADIGAIAICWPISILGFFS